VIGADDSALEDAPKAFDGLGVNHDVDLLALGIKGLANHVSLRPAVQPDTGAAGHSSQP